MLAMVVMGMGMVLFTASNVEASPGDATET
jgi:hypothetical protein